MTINVAAQNARQGCALFDMNTCTGLITVEGPDCVSFLNNITSNYVAQLPEGRGNRNALLTKKSTIIADFDLFRIDDHVLLHLDSNQVEATLQHLDNFIFAEDVSCRREPTGIFAIAGLTADEVLQRVAVTQELGNVPPYSIVRLTIANHDVYAARRTLTGDPGWLILTYPNASTDVKKALVDSGAKEFDHDVLEVLRIEAGELVREKDYDEKTLLLELNLGEKIYSIDKGCYPGQEVVSRVVNRGKIPRMLMGLVVEGETRLRPGMSIEFDGKAVGTTKSSTYSPALNAQVAITNLKNDVADDGAQFDFVFNGNTVRCRVVRLPFYESPTFRSRAEALYADGMVHYHADRFEEAEAAFRHAIEIRDNYADAWEALAMTVEKRGDIDAAIVLNRAFAKLDPNAVMARSNLSRLYMLQGFKDKAEEEMGKAQAIEFRLKMRERMGGVSAQKAILEQRKQDERAETERKMKTFLQVLELDPEDEIAHFGLGKLRLESGDAIQAVEHLSVVIRNNKEYSAAYDLLAKAQKEAGDTDNARATLERGIAVAVKRGDLMPAKSMKQLLAELVNS